MVTAMTSVSDALASPCAIAASMPANSYNVHTTTSANAREREKTETSKAT